MFYETGDKLLENRFKNTGGQTKNPREVNVTFVSNDNKLTYVMMIVYQVKFFKIEESRF